MIPVHAQNCEDENIIIEAIDCDLEFLGDESPVEINLDELDDNSFFEIVQDYINSAGETISTTLKVVKLPGISPQTDFGSGEYTTSLTSGSTYSFTKTYTAGFGLVITHQAVLKKADSSHLVVLSDQVSGVPPRLFYIQNSNVTHYNAYDWEVRSYGNISARGGATDATYNVYVDMSAAISLYNNTLAVSYSCYS